MLSTGHTNRYVDRDDFVPAYEEERKTTSEAEDTPVAESMKKLPNRFAKLSKAGEGIQQRVTREGNFQVRLSKSPTIYVSSTDPFRCCSILSKELPPLLSPPSFYNFKFLFLVR